MAKEWQMDEWKACAICKQMFQIKDFAPNKVRGVYQYNRCRPCNKARKAKNNKDTYEYQYEQKKKRIAENPEKYREINRRWKHANPEMVKAQRDRWRSKYPEYHKTKTANAQYLRQSGLIEELLIIQDNKCLYCDRIFKTENIKEYTEDKYTLDHWIPNRIEIDNTYSNLSLCCFKCNQIKSHLEPTKAFGEEKAKEIYQKLINNAETLVDKLNTNFGHKIEIYEDVKKEHFRLAE